MPWFEHDGLRFSYLDEGQGLPFIFLHGLGADVTQPRELFTPFAGVRFLSFDCRAHGQTCPVGDESKISIATFADDLAAFMDYLGVRQAVVGGVSMGAAVTLNFTLRSPERALGLVQSRPAWLEGPRAENVALFSLVARHIRVYGLNKGRELFLLAPEYLRLVNESPTSAASLLGQFDAPRAEETVVKLERIPPDRPNDGLSPLESIHVPTLVLANRQDVIHPFEYGETLARTIPGAEFRELTPKSADAVRHTAEVREHLTAFLKEHFLRRESTC